MTSERESLILGRVRDTPAGFVRTYGDVSPGAPRVAGAVLHECEDPTVPWHRIVRADGSKQWAFKGKPLYRFSGDEKPGETAGETLEKISNRQEHV